MQGRGQVIEDVIEHRAPGDIGDAEVQMHGVPQPGEVLLGQWPVQAQGMARLGQRGVGRRDLRQAQVVQGRVAIAQVQQDKDDQGHPQQNRDQQHKPQDDIAQHGLGLPGGWVHDFKRHVKQRAAELHVVDVVSADTDGRQM